MTRRPWQRRIRLTLGKLLNLRKGGEADGLEPRELSLDWSRWRAI